MLIYIIRNFIPINIDISECHLWKSFIGNINDFLFTCRSIIHGRGLFCKRDIDAGEMVIEYAGEVIRSILTDKREKYYEGKGIGCYMFRIDDDDVVDATVHGNAARFINHSCDVSQLFYIYVASKNSLTIYMKYVWLRKYLRKKCFWESNLQLF